MSKRQKFIDRTARKPSGETAKKKYSNPTFHYRSFKIILNKLRLRKNDRYVEIGCGGGALLKKALKTVSHVSAIDHSRDMLEATKKNIQHCSYDHLDLIQGDAGNLPWKDKSFTAAGCANMFFFVKNPQQVLNEICRILTPGGRFAMVTMKKSLLTKITFGWLYGLRTYSNRKMISMMKKAGFKKVRVNSKFGLMQICYGER